MILDNILLKYGLKIIDASIFPIANRNQNIFLQNFSVDQSQLETNLS